jgi:hypothetical protein
MLRYQQLIRANMDQLSEIITKAGLSTKLQIDFN